MVEIIRMGFLGDPFLYKEEEITEEEYQSLKDAGLIYKPEKVKP